MDKDNYINITEVYSNKSCDRSECTAKVEYAVSYNFITINGERKNSYTKDNKFKTSTESLLCHKHAKEIHEMFKQSSKVKSSKEIKEIKGIKRVTHGSTRLDANNPIQEFDVEDYRVATFHFYITAYQGPDKEKHEIPKTEKDVIKIMDLDEFSPVVARAYIEFNNRFEWLVGNKKYESKMYMGELFTFTNSDVSRCIRIVLEKHPECEWVDIELDILKEPR